MKKFTLLTAVLFFTIFSNAQINKGSTIIGGSLGGSISESDDQNSETKNSSWNFEIQTGRFIANNKAVGFFFNYNYGLLKSEYTGSFPSSNEGESNGYGGGIFYRQYFPISAKWYVFGDAKLGYFRNTNRSESNDKLTYKSKGWNTHLSLTPGVSFAAGRRLYIESSFSNLFSLGYSKSKTDQYDISGAVTDTDNNKSFGFHANTSGLNNINFGLRWILPGKTR